MRALDTLALAPQNDAIRTALLVGDNPTGQVLPALLEFSASLDFEGMMFGAEPLAVVFKVTSGWAGFPCGDADGTTQPVLTTPAVSTMPVPPVRHPGLMFPSQVLALRRLRASAALPVLTRPSSISLHHRANRQGLVALTRTGHRVSPFRRNIALPLRRKSGSIWVLWRSCAVFLLPIVLGDSLSTAFGSSVD
jgi:hypothetical protein